MRTLRSTRRVLRMESLDKRNLLTGDCAVAIEDGVLDITCDDDDNWVLVSGFNGAISVSSNQGTTFNGVAGPVLVTEAIDEVFLKGRRGDDILQVNFLDVDTVRIGGGSGNDEIIAGVLNVEQLRINSGQGTDLVGVLDVTASDRVVLKGRDDDDCISAFSLDVSGKLILDGGDGNDIGGVSNSTFGGLTLRSIETLDPSCGLGTAIATLN